MLIRHKLSIMIFSIAGCWLTSCSTVDSAWNEPDVPGISSSAGNKNQEGAKTYGDYYTSESTVADVIRDPAFGDFGRLLFPVDRPVTSSMTLAQVSTSDIYMWYPYIRVEKTVEILNHLHSQAAKGEQIFHRIYSEEEINEDPSKADTGIFVFRGTPGKPFAITNAGGGFAYVGAMHDSFPHSLELSKAGYTAFALIYRPDDPYNDLARALTFVIANAETLGVAKSDYSLWGGSAGARMAATLGNKAILDRVTGKHPDVTQAAAVIMQYTGYSSVSEYDAPTYSCVGTNDGIAPWRTMRDRLERLSALGIPTEFHVYEGLSHGFGIGTGTVAEGWVNDAINFWKANMKTGDNSGLPPVHAD